MLSNKCNLFWYPKEKTASFETSPPPVFELPHPLASPSRFRGSCQSHECRFFLFDVRRKKKTFLLTLQEKASDGALFFFLRLTLNDDFHFGNFFFLYCRSLWSWTVLEALRFYILSYVDARMTCPPSLLTQLKSKEQQRTLFSTPSPTLLFVGCF